MSRILIALITAALAGCTTSLVPLNQAKATPAEHIHTTTHTTPVAGSQSITLVRNAGALFAAGTRLDVFVDGELTAELATSEALRLYLPAGEHLLTTKIAGQVATVAVTVPSKFTIYRIDVNDEYVKLQPSAD
ncbi:MULTISPECIES: hypothetical protein [Paraburkholderia]|uniref:DUF2846 domain-containing protein n=1 Tax=Paraburkholderia podalyriae TaxID=1938811 RepID=A0ABR7PQJ8_9BURK|nr:hypothetical protein [Paraburkholderia podalyriae]MBC8748525.1 hypothetical protein [Paraburkholderia podalyriae]